MAERQVYSFNDIVNVVINQLGISAPTITDFYPGSNIRSLIESVVSFVEFLQLQINVAFEAFKISGANGQDLDNRVQDFGISRNQAVAATNPVLFGKNSPASSQFTIFGGSKVSTQPDVFGNTIDYTLNTDLIFPSGAMSVTGIVTCTTPGLIGNVPINYITNITSSIPGVDYINNTVAFTSGAEQENDNQLRSRIPVFLNGLQQGNLASIQAAALSVPGINFVRVDQNVPASGQITVYVSNQSGVLSTSQLLSVKQAVANAGAFGIVSNVATPTISYVVMSMNIIYDSVNYNDPSPIVTNVQNTIYNYVSVNGTTTLQISDLIVLIKSLQGIKNVTNLTINGLAQDYVASGFSVVRLTDPVSPITVNAIAG